jgi:hypothetical protein
MCYRRRKMLLGGDRSLFIMVAGKTLRASRLLGIGGIIANRALKGVYVSLTGDTSTARPL